MAERSLADNLAEERSRAVRVLLGSPLLNAERDPEAFRLVRSHASWCAEYFEAACGWGLVVDVSAGFARLAKRSAHADPSRPLRRTRGSGQAFDRRRYQLLCLVCAELVRHPVTTVGLLAGAVAADAGLDTSRHHERAAFVDALRALVDVGALRTTVGDVDAFLDSDRGNAILTADTARLHRMLASAVAPSTLDAGLDTGAAAAALTAEPRYGDAPLDPDSTEEEQRLRWLRHTLARRLLDDPVVYLDELSGAERDYLANPAGRRWLRERVAEAGFELEERAEGLLAVDPDGLASDLTFPAPQGNAYQLALLLVDPLVPAGPDGERRPTTASAAALRREVAAVLERFPTWARSYRDDDGPDRLVAEAVDALVNFRLARREPGGAVRALPALARYRAGEPVVSGGDGPLFAQAGGSGWAEGDGT